MVLARKPYLDSDMQSRWWDFGGDTVVRADQYVQDSNAAATLKERAEKTCLDTYDSRLIALHAQVGSSQEYRSQRQIGRFVTLDHLPPHSSLISGPDRSRVQHWRRRESLW